MKTKLLICFLAFAALILSSCEAKFDLPWLKNKPDAASVPTRDVTVGAFDSIRLDGIGNLVIDDSLPAGVVRLTAEKGNAGKLNAVLDGQTLVLTSEDGIHFDSGKAEYRVNPGADLKLIDLKGIGGLEASQTWKGKDLTLQLEGLGKMEIELTADHLTVVQKGSGQIIVKGTATNLDVKAAGLGQVNAEDLVSQNATVESSGVGEVRVNATAKLTVNASGMGAVNYKGNPAQKSFNSSGVTSIKPIDD